LKYAQHLNPKQTPQTAPIPGSKQIPNSGGGYSFQVDDWTRLRRFLILGSEGGSYYATERKLTLQNAQCVQRCLAADGKRTVDEIVKISQEGRAPKNDPAIFALALACRSKDPEVANHARGAIPKVCRIGTHLFHLVEALQTLGGWGRGIRHAIANWYLSQDYDDLAYQLIKYPSRDSWSHRDVLRKAHAKPADDIYRSMFGWVTEKKKPAWGDTVLAPEDPLSQLWASDTVKSLDVEKKADLDRLTQMISAYRLPREALPTEALNKAEVWEVLLQDMPVHALVRNLGKMSEVGLIAPLSAGEKRAMEILGDGERLRRARLHPMQVLVALNTYRRGHGVKGSLKWDVSQRIVDALDEAFYATFATIEPTGKRTLLGIDCSASMRSPELAGMTGITPTVGAAVMAMVTARVEKQHYFFGFCHKFVDLKISPRMRLDEVEHIVQRSDFGSTDCSLPMAHAYKNNLEVDAFLVYTDSETNHGNIHPAQAIKQYRRERVDGAKLAVIAFTANNVSIADPADGGMMDFCGLDTSMPQVIADFVGGRI